MKIFKRKKQPISLTFTPECILQNSRKILEVEDGYLIQEHETGYSRTPLEAIDFVHAKERTPYPDRKTSMLNFYSNGAIIDTFQIPETGSRTHLKEAQDWVIKQVEDYKLK